MDQKLFNVFLNASNEELTNFGRPFKKLLLIFQHHQKLWWLESHFQLPYQGTLSTDKAADLYCILYISYCKQYFHLADNFSPFPRFPERKLFFAALIKPNINHVYIQWIVSLYFKLTRFFRMVDDLRFLFSNKTHHEKPFLLVGAELGAINARFYAQMYQE